MSSDLAPIAYYADPEHISVEDVLVVFAQGGWTRQRTAEQVGRMLRGSAFMVLAKRGTEPVGFARIISDLTFRGFVEDVIVLPSVRQKGVGRALMQILEGQARRAGIPRLELTTQQPEFWSKLGYTAKPNSQYLVKLLG